jgi:hypothetical protein
MKLDLVSPTVGANYHGFMTGFKSRGAGANYHGFMTGFKSRGAHRCEEQWYVRDTMI